MISTVPNLHVILQYLVYLCLLAGVALIIFKPFFPGLAVMVAGLLAYVAYESFVARDLAGIGLVPLISIVVLSAIGLTSAWWSEKLGIRFTYMSQQVMWGAIIGSFIGIFLFGMLGMVLGLIIGTLAMELRGGRPLPEAARQGVGAVLSMLGPRGFQLIMALVVGMMILRYTAL